MIIGHITYVTGDATDPIGDGRKIIAHVCNDIGGWGAGFVMALSARWEEPERAYRLWSRSGIDGRASGDFAGGEIQLVRATEGIAVANMVAQGGVVGPTNPKPIDYEWLYECLHKLSSEAVRYGASVHMPRIGCGLAGGKWCVVEALIMGTLSKAGVPVTVYDL